MNITKLISHTLLLLKSRAFLLLFASLLVISFSVAYVASEPRQHERFLSISTLDKNLMSDDYYPRANSTIKVNDRVKWHLDIHNRMGSVEYLSVRVKLLNSTQAAPGDTLHVPSRGDPIIELRQALMNNSTWIVPLKWSITEIDEMQDHVVIRSLSINDKLVDDLNVRSVGGKNFRMVIELWRYDIESGDFVFTWSSGIDKRIVWNQIWFNIKSSI